MYRPVRLGFRILPAMESTDTRDQNPSGMDGDEAQPPTADHVLQERPHSGLAASPYGHLGLRDRRTPEERVAASLRESARRKGRGRAKWWEQGGD